MSTEAKLPSFNENGDLPPGIHMIHNDHELEVMRERLAKMERVLEALRKTARPEEWPALSSSYRLEIERMQGEILDYLMTPVSVEETAA